MSSPPPSENPFSSTVETVVSEPVVVETVVSEPVVVETVVSEPVVVESVVGETVASDPVVALVSENIETVSGEIVVSESVLVSETVVSEPAPVSETVVSETVTSVVTPPNSPVCQGCDCTEERTTVRLVPCKLSLSDVTPSARPRVAPEELPNLPMTPGVVVSAPASASSVSASAPAPVPASAGVPVPVTPVPASVTPVPASVTPVPASVTPATASVPVPPTVVTPTNVVVTLFPRNGAWRLSGKWGLQLTEFPKNRDLSGNAVVTANLDWLYSIDSSWQNGPRTFVGDKQLFRTLSAHGSRSMTLTVSNVATCESLVIQQVWKLDDSWVSTHVTYDSHVSKQRWVYKGTAFEVLNFTF